MVGGCGSLLLPFMGLVLVRGSGIQFPVKKAESDVLSTWRSDVSFSLHRGYLHQPTINSINSILFS